jgi:TRAP-type C4-dicarboxylate transport system permease small subunit
LAGIGGKVGMDSLKRISEGIAKYFNWVACVGICGIMVVTCADVIGRAFRHPIFGAYDLVCMLAAVAFSFALAYTQVMKNHIGVDFLTSRLPHRAQGIMGAIVYLLCIGLLVVFAWRSAVLARSLWVSGEVTMTMQLPYHFFVYGVGLACLPLCLVFFIDFLNELSKTGIRE